MLTWTLPTVKLPSFSSQLSVGYVGVIVISLTVMLRLCRRRLLQDSGFAAVDFEHIAARSYLFAFDDRVRRAGMKFPIT